MNDTPNSTPENALQPSPDTNAADSGKNAEDGTSYATYGTNENRSVHDGAKNSTHSPVTHSFNLIYAALITLTVLLVLAWWSSAVQINQMREELARRLQATDVSSAETKAIAKSMLEANKELQVQLGVLESKQVESESHELALQQLYQDLSKNRDDWALSEIEQVLSTASQQLQLAGNVQGALIALQNADARLARSDKPQFITIRRAIAHDIDRLKALPNLDLPGIALRLDSAIAQVDNMPLLIDDNPPGTDHPASAHHVESQSKKLNRVKKNSTNAAQEVIPATDDVGLATRWKRWLDQYWQSWTTEMWNELRQLIRIRNVANPDALMLAPSQGYFVKENIKLRLLNARLALLSRNETAFKSDLITAQKEIAHYFDSRAKQTQAVQALLRQIQNSDLSIELPSLTESLNAVRNFTLKQ